MSVLSAWDITIKGWLGGILAGSGCFLVVAAIIGISQDRISDAGVGLLGMAASALWLYDEIRWLCWLYKLKKARRDAKRRLS